MRVIAGSKRGLLLETPKGMTTRPTTDRIKETLFNILQNDFDDIVFLDLFSGSGQIGIEALSRGASKAIFIDKDRNAIDCIRRNVDHTGFLAQSEIKSMSVIEGLKTLREEHVDLIFMDPPYHEELEREILCTLKDMPYISKNTLIIIEADLHTSISFVTELGYEIIRTKKYKTNQHYFLKRIVGDE